MSINSNLIEAISFEPNPFNDYLKTNLSNNTSVSFVSLLGTVRSLQVKNGLIDTSSLPSGVYVLKTANNILGRVVKL